MANQLLTDAAALLRATDRDEDYELRLKDWQERYARSREPEVWQITLAGKSVKVEELPLKVIDRIAKAAGQSWFLVCNTPVNDLAITMDLVAAAAEHLEVDVPEALTLRQAIDLFALVPDNVPEADVVVDDDGPFGDRSGQVNGTLGSQR